MPQPTPRLDDDALVAEILTRVPEAGDERRVRSLLAAWWRYAGVRNAAGAVVDSDTFIAERGALGLLELSPAIAGRVIELEFALLHDPATSAQPAPAPAPAPMPAPPPPAPAAEPTLRVVPPPAPPAAAAPAPAPAPPKPVAAAPAPPKPVAPPPPPKPVAAAPAPAPVPVAPAPAPAPVPVEAADVAVEFDEAVPITAFEAFQEVRERTREQAQTAVMAGFVVFFTLVVGLALVAGQNLDHLALPSGASEPLVAGWRAFLAIFAGFGGAIVGFVAAMRLQGRRGALLPPVVGLLGLGVLGLGLLSGSVVIVAVGAGAFALGGLAALLRR